MSQENRALVASALVHSGFTPAQARNAVATISDTDRPIADLVREALQYAATPGDKTKRSPTTLEHRAPHVAGVLRATAKPSEGHPRQLGRFRDRARHQHQRPAAPPARPQHHEERPGRPPKDATNAGNAAVYVAAGVSLASLLAVIFHGLANRKSDDELVIKAEPKAEPKKTTTANPDGPCTGTGTVNVDQSKGPLAGNLRAVPWGKVIEGVPNGSVVKLLGSEMVPEPNSTKQARWYHVETTSGTRGSMHGAVIRC